MTPFRVALSGDFRKADGSPAYPMFDLAPLRREPDLELAHVEPVDGVMRAEDLGDFDALILLAPRFDRRTFWATDACGSSPRFGVGYDNVDVAARTAGRHRGRRSRRTACAGRWRARSSPSCWRSPPALPQASP